MSQDLGRVGSDLDGLENMETTKGEESEDGDDSRVKRTRRVHPRLDFSRCSNAQKTKAGPTRLQRTQKVSQTFSQTFSHPVQVLGACAAGKSPKVVLNACEGRGMEAVSTCSAEGQSKLLLIRLKLRCVWFGFEIIPSTDRTHRTVLQ